jgi:serine-type D-Ala-D-Ala carboxypeptidase/endopeptidase (penicillin-binding protein 4)
MQYKHFLKSKGNEECKKNKKMRCNTLFFLWAFVCFVLISSPSHSYATSSSSITTKIKTGGFAFVTQGEVINNRGNTLFIPASTLKILTNLHALESLGQDFRYSTYFYLDDFNNLYIQGRGDPFLVSENVREIVSQLRMKGVTSIDNIVLDTSFFRLENMVPGTQNSQNPYDALNSSLSVNFNTLPITVGPSGKISSSEKQTPLIPLMQEIGKKLPVGTHRVNVSGFRSKNKQNNISRYTGELFTALFKEIGVQVKGHFREGKTPNSSQQIFTYTSEKNLMELVRMNLKYSNNFIANQIFLTCGAYKFGPPATWKKAQMSIVDFTHTTLGVDAADFTILEGSGLSRQNKITPNAMITVLGAFRPYAHLLNRRNTHLLKSGTLKGIYNYAGYFEKDKKLFPFTLFYYGEKNIREILLIDLYNDFLIRESQTSVD